MPVSPAICLAIWQAICLGICYSVCSALRSSTCSFVRLARVLGGEIDRLKGGYECLCVHFASWAAFIKAGWNHASRSRRRAYALYGWAYRACAMFMQSRR